METAYVVKLNRPEETLKGILELLSDDKKRNNLTENAYNIVQEYEWKNVGQKYLKIYKDLCNIS